MRPGALLHLRDQPDKRLQLSSGQPLTIGRASGNRLVLPHQEGVSEHHAVVRFSARHGWLVCDWQSRDGTYLEGQRIQRCRPLGDGDEIQLGRRGPVLVFRLADAAEPEAPPAATTAAAATTSAKATAAAAGSRPTGVAAAIDIGGEAIRPGQIRSAVVQSEPRHPHIFSWWVLLSVGLLLLLPFRIGPVAIFWPLELAALAGWLALSSRKDHTLVVVLQDGRTRRRRFTNRRTALAHRNGLRRAIGESQGS
ncbi:FHA domain-containing protein [Synechococcus sp. GFB01]|uniref:FHA domain-containing protein n=1 Tax=Synechococcus sp. GFB01 TaxID=1662190 RepID=UPI00064F9D8D|nr:FHA domain-containing protein [Synechococcus sp. GFB01]KMM16356.1 hypothetical protein SYNGFB01_11755 [Synechococcus sp. GFB01]